MLLGTRILSVEEGGYGCGMGQSEGKKDSIGGGRVYWNWRCQHKLMISNTVYTHAHIFERVCLYTYVFSCQPKWPRCKSTPMSTSGTQILVSNTVFQLKGIWAPRRNGWLQDWGQERYEMSLEWRVMPKTEEMLNNKKDRGAGLRGSPSDPIQDDLRIKITKERNYTLLKRGILLP